MAHICLPVHCLSAPMDWQPYYHTNATSHSLLRDDQIARANRMPVRCRCVAVGATSYCHPGHHTNVVAHCLLIPCLVAKNQKNPRAHKNKIGTPPPPKTPPKKGEFYGHGFSYRKNAFFPGVHKIGAPISGPRIADTNFTDTRIFLKKSLLATHVNEEKFPEAFAR